MGCIYSDFEGVCSLSIDSDGETVLEDMQGSENGICIVEDDPDPSESCDSYESDWSCDECGADLNVTECECEDE